MTNPKGGMPESEHPEEEDLPFEMPADQGGSVEEFSLEPASMSASIEDFQFSGLPEELDFTEPTDLFPQAQPGEVQPDHGTDSAYAEPGPGEQFFDGAEAAPAAAEEAVEAEGAGAEVADLEQAEEEEGAKPRFSLPPWARTVEWVMIGVLGVVGLAALVCEIVWVKDAKQVALTLNIACPVLLALIPYALWRSSVRWVSPQITALYTVLLALSTAALIIGTWCEGVELSRYDFQYSKSRVAAARPPRVIMPTADEAGAVPTPAPEAAKASEQPAAAAQPAGGAQPVAAPEAAKTPAAAPEAKTPAAVPESKTPAAAPEAAKTPAAAPEAKTPAAVPEPGKTPAPASAKP